HRILEPCILEYEPIPDLAAGVRFCRDRRSIFGIPLSKFESSPPVSAAAGTAGAAVGSSGAAKGRRESVWFRCAQTYGTRARRACPKVVTTLFSSILLLLRVYHVHPWLV